MTSPQIDFDALRPIGWPWPGMPEEPAWLAAMAAHPLARPARVSEQHRTGYVVADAVDTGFKVESLPEWQRPRFPSHERAAVGDWVLLEDDKRIVALLPRRTAIKRGAAGEHYHQQVIAANIDTVFIVCGLDADFNPRRIERYLLLVGGGGAEPVVILTKADLTEYADDALAVLEELAAQSIPLLTVNAKDADSVAALRPWLGAGRTAVLVGSSGAGKSTLTNTLLGVEKMRTAAVRENDSRGRHTTTHRALLPLPSGACLIDTPGMRELKPTGEEDLAEGGFADIEALAAQCRFNNCAHQAEPGCAVQAAIERGDIEEARLANYMKLRDEVAGAASKLAQRQAQNADAARSGRPGAGKPGGKRPTPRNQRR
ncbi:ribosome small subunit-dependent GTPase A [Xanthomonas translucens pv. translucens]|uniref:Small ribosomal subunit biogenesis GTPase RsgA n=2 Tax=Xanthomonas campestris pv. translucens TaxID=343 RepID=A0ABW9KV82_XANCT|nr:ribosome small subunit-dependent GTPase A [Xanthomonas translucens]MCT8285610.1 ribosome small subunit-dependent GTPase A [Xanthomonas translucens pv. translucens]MCT8303268.1 ribosome small subunit-dependent GTPase A [Xanthomonas translucens pv. translucens]QSQ30208.1 ribosome small subunit-dependent GTPase A [Xanthomonas translucens pv. translucens]QSQ33987.1 ribosome small subunit-dependent GTPase A [Xanthomonas translucens pv. translucens]QSQ45107.1 ribosome small subunit-dependent GTPa